MSSTASETEMKASSDPSSPPKESVENDTSEDDEANLPKGLQLFLIFVSLCLTVFLCALDALILATAIPKITSHFNSLGDYAWYSSAYMLTTCSFQLPYGRAYKLLSTKWVYFVAILIFELGSVLCGAATSSVMLIIGRAVAGLGSAGIFGGTFIIISEVTPLSKRSLYAGSLGAMFGIASVVGPLLGGAFTDKVSWRWCFYINLPIGAIALALVPFFLPSSNKQSFRTLTKEDTMLKTLLRFDPIGTAILVPSLVCLLLALEWGSSIYGWSDGRVIALLVVFGVTIIAWIMLQWYEGDEATVPKSVVSQRTVGCAFVYTFAGAIAFTIVTYYLPLWFQAVKQNNAVTSGIHQLPLILSLVISSIAAGGAVVLIGYYVPFLLLGTVCSSIGTGLLMTLHPGSSIGQWIGYEILFGVGAGMIFEQCNVAVQASLPKDKIAAGTSLTIFARSLGGSLAAPIAQAVFAKDLRSELIKALPHLNADIISGAGATDLVAKIESISGGDQRILQIVLGVYNHAVTRCFLIALVFASVTIVPALGVEWRSVKKDKTTQKKEGAGEDEEKGESPA